MDFLIHSKNSSKKYGGEASDYYKIHKFMDSFKTCLADSRHRLFLHNTGGIHAATIAFGDYIKNSAGKDVSVRDIATDHVLEDLRTVPTVEEVCGHLSKKDFALFNSRILGELIKGFRKRTKEIVEEAKSLDFSDITKNSLKLAESEPDDVSIIVGKPGIVKKD